VDQRWQAAGAHPKALSLIADGHKWRQILASGAAEAVLSDVDPAAFVHQGFCARLVKVGGLAYLDAQRASGADGEAKAGPIAQRLVYYSCFSIHHDDGSLGAWGHTDATAITQFFIDPNDLA